ncbi:hypothetical protein B0H13DRAFT_973654 [Mycena leptocephala]|nr:hypothetical protein B0H13DRAFT_973654 [Mycena leptocephala]
MPLNVADTTLARATPASLLDRPEEFIIFYADVEDGRMWCSDCRAVDEQVQKTFAAQDGPSAVIVYVGSKPNWKAKDNIFRGEPFKITDVPTVVKMRERKEVGRLVDTEINPKLADFVADSIGVAGSIGHE